MEFVVGLIILLAEKLTFTMQLCGIVESYRDMELMVRLDLGSASSSASACLSILEEVV